MINTTDLKLWLERHGLVLVEEATIDAEDFGARQVEVREIMTPQLSQQTRTIYGVEIDGVFVYEDLLLRFTRFAEYDDVDTSVLIDEDAIAKVLVTAGLIRPVSSAGKLFWGSLKLKAFVADYLEMTRARRGG